MLGTVHQWTALNGHLTTIGLDLIVGTYHTRLHVEGYDQFVALLPLALDVHITVLGDQ